MKINVWINRKKTQLRKRKILKKETVVILTLLLDFWRAFPSFLNSLLFFFYCLFLTTFILFFVFRVFFCVRFAFCLFLSFSLSSYFHFFRCCYRLSIFLVFFFVFFSFLKRKKNLSCSLTKWYSPSLTLWPDLWPFVEHSFLWSFSWIFFPFFLSLSLFPFFLRPNWSFFLSPLRLKAWPIFFLFSFLLLHLPCWIRF